MGDIYHAGEVYAGSVPIDDTQASEETVYSSAKVETMIEVVQEEITDLKNTIILRAGDTGVGVGSRISLSDSMSNYRFILMKTRGSDNKDGSVFLPVSSINNNLRVVGTYGDSVGVYRFSRYSDNNISFDVAPESSMKIYQVLGYK